MPWLLAVVAILDLNSDGIEHHPRKTAALQKGARNDSKSKESGIIIHIPASVSSML